jgi:hypothetical protein
VETRLYLRQPLLIFPKYC